MPAPAPPEPRDRPGGYDLSARDWLSLAAVAAFVWAILAPLV